jgi:hypothetical protein
VKLLFKIASSGTGYGPRRSPVQNPRMHEQIMGSEQFYDGQLSCTTVRHAGLMHTMSFKPDLPVEPTMAGFGAFLEVTIPESRPTTLKKRIYRSNCPSPGALLICGPTRAPVAHRHRSTAPAKSTIFEGTPSKKTTSPATVELCSALVMVDSSRPGARHHCLTTRSKSTTAISVFFHIRSRMNAGA